MSDKGDIQQVGIESVGVSKRQRRIQAVRAHFKKWWWAHFLAFAACVLIITLPLIYLGYPKIAQSDVNKSKLNITNLAFSDPTPDSIHINQTQVLTNHAIYHPKIFSFNATVSLAGATAPLTVVTVPKIQAENGAIINVDTVVQLNNTAAVTEFTKAVLGSEYFGMNIYGRPVLKEGPLPKSTVTFNKTVNMTGMNGLKGFQLQDIRISLTAAEDGTNMNGSVSIPNPSVVSVSLGNVTMDIFVNDTQIGKTFINDLSLKPGPNVLPVKSIINQTQVIGLVSGSKAPYPGGVIPLSIKGNSSVYNGVEIPYYTEGLAANTLETTMNVTQVLLDSGLAELAGIL